MWQYTPLRHCRASGLTYADQIHEAIHAVADLEEDVAALPDGMRAEGRPQQPGDAGHQEEGAQEHSDDLHLLHQGDGDGLPLRTGEGHGKHRAEAPDYIFLLDCFMIWSFFLTSLYCVRVFYVIKQQNTMYNSVVEEKLSKICYKNILKIMLNILQPRFIFILLKKYSVFNWFQKLNT